MKAWLEDPRPTKLLHHAKYDTHVFANEGIDLRGVADDTMLQAYVLESHRGVGLEDLCLRRLGIKGTSYEQLCGKGAHQIGFDEVDLERATHYACEDADFTLRLHKVLRPEVSATEAEIVAYTRERLAHYKCPTSVVFADTLPRNASGKLLKRDLRLTHGAQFA